METNFGLASQTWLWSGGYFAFVVMCGWSGVVLYRMVGVDSQDAWAWRELANLSSWHGMHEEAQGILEEGLGRNDAARRHYQRAGQLMQADTSPMTPVKQVSRLILNGEVQKRLGVRETP